MITITITCSTTDEALEAIQRLSGISAVVASDTASDAPATPKKATTKAKAEEATTAGLKKGADKAPAKSKVPTEQELKDHIAELANGDTDAIKAFVRSFGVKKVSDLSEAQRKKAFDGAAEYFAADESEDAEEDEDPMN